MAKKLATFDKFYQKVEFVLVLKIILHINKEWMVHLKKDILLHGYISKLVVLDYKVFPNAFHCVKNLCRFVLDKKYLIECTLSDLVFYFKVCK